jgi:hypothetical protein
VSKEAVRQQTKTVGEMRLPESWGVWISVVLVYMELFHLICCHVAEPHSSAHLVQPDVAPSLRV